MRTSELIEKNNELRQLLNPENKQFYSDFLVYMRFKTVIKDSFTVEILLLEILNDILDAQDEGTNAVQYFGKNPKQVADELLVTLSNSWQAMLYFGGIIFGCYGLYTILLMLAMPTGMIDLGQILLFIISGFIIVWFILKYLGNLVYQVKRTIKSNILRILLMILSFTMIVALGGGIGLLKTPLRFLISSQVSMGIVMIIMAALTIWYFKIGKPKMLPIYVTGMGLGILGILLRL
ncbi:DUF1129 domain-containing protein [Periweissella fabalis]|uniref:DUF1129 domain-containing protein n=1 Tax=Periweissella fabalis TaxID=1070421 RepID=A0A7X6N0A5_9LACO|nr:DUF1129 domain-containing protein [Periweissella fabalis]MCM0599076.1 hypothetical protein [Periweissella fabalis]NKZ23356.1 DUF1129 domain-containing protein [Periweissella fabalis]